MTSSDVTNSIPDAPFHKEAAKGLYSFSFWDPNLGGTCHQAAFAMRSTFWLSCRIGEWREFRRNVLEDYRLVFGEEPWDIVAVWVMTDASNIFSLADLAVRGIAPIYPSIGNRCTGIHRRLVRSFTGEQNAKHHTF